MEKLIIIKYGELSTKKDNINFFLKLLKDNITSTLKNIDCQISYDKGRMFIETSKIQECVDKLKFVFGIHEIVIGYIIEDTEFNNLSDSILKLIKEKQFKTFKVITKRSNKRYPLDSMEISRKIGGIVLNNIKDTEVDVHDPELKINIEIRNTNALIYFDSIKGLGGYPVSTQGKGLLMLSGGIDSPVAGYMAIKRGIKLEAIYFESPPHTSENAKDKVFKLGKILAKYNNDINVHVINFTKIQEAIYTNIPREYLITIMRRMMYRISAIIAHNRNAHILINGESIGQVASQTLTSMSAINEVVKMPVIRPVACFDKLEIIDIAKKIGTYETSILPFEDCCTIFVPDHPVINPVKSLCEEYEKLIPYEDLIHEAIKTHEVIKLTSAEDNKYSNIL